MLIRTSPEAVFKLHVRLILLLLCAHGLGLLSRLHFDHDHVYGLVPLFDLNAEKNVPTFFSALMIAACAALLYVIGSRSRTAASSSLPWFGLSAVFLFLSIDEISGIHERFNGASRAAFDTSGFLYFAWVIPYGVALLVLAAVYARFLLRLPRDIRLLFLASGALFVAGAVGFEMLGARQAESAGLHGALYAAFYTCEELLEMLGIAVFLHALLRHVVRQSGSLEIAVLPGQG